MTILHIIPDSPPKADVALSLAQGLRDSYQVNSLFYCPQKVESDIYTPYGFDTLVSELPSLYQHVPSNVRTILLHVNRSTYKAYLGKNKARTFINDLKRVLGRRSLELITIFHEIPTNKLSSLFIINPRCHYLTKELADLSISVITNNRLFENHLIEKTSTSIICVNNFSRVGELKSNNLLGASRCNLVVLGGAERANIYKNKTFLNQVTEALKINQIVDIGQPLKWSQINTKGLNIRKLGQLLKSEISDQLTISKVGILDYCRYPGCLGKSSVFNAYKAHGVAPLMVKNMGSSDDGILAGTNYFTAKEIDKLKSDRTIARMAHTNYDRYQTHNQAQWVKLIQELTNH